MLRVREAVAGLALMTVAGSAWASGPRWVTGPPYFTTDGQPVIWYTDTPQYFTDPGDLSSTVNHAAADRIVAAAAGVWNISTSRLTLTQGGMLDEHVSGANAYPDANGVVFPADVLPGNYLAKQIAVIYDYDGSVTDLLLGVGASDPSGCRQNAVTESVDSIVPSGYIEHAVLVLNGRCTGSEPEKQIQMQYQLMRAFGRVLGLGWSQTNDNVFTNSPTPTPQQALNWPVMHPIDIICGPYTYQCMPQPFMLRMDDISGMALLYFIPQGQAGPGKVDSLTNASRIGGHIYFSLEYWHSMQGVNVVGRRLRQYTMDSNVEQWDSVSSVSGALFRRTNANAVMGEDDSLQASMGGVNGFYEGWYEFARVPLDAEENWQWMVIETEAVNPLYTGAYSVGPYVSNTVQPSGSKQSVKWGIFGAYQTMGWIDVVVGDAASTCTNSGGAESAPQIVGATGWWTGALCSYRWTSWWSMTAAANRSMTIEVTAQDEQGFASTAKGMPVIGVWKATDALGTPPTVAAQTGALNGISAGLTSLHVDGVPAGGLRIAIADQRGDGRPDFNFGARVLYADAVSPTNVPVSGGPVTISGMGFRAGNVVKVNGVAAAVQSWSANAIVATVPALQVLTGASTQGLVASVEVSDRLTGGTTLMTRALTYGTPQADVMTLVSGPSGTVMTGGFAETVFAVRVMKADGVTAVTGAAVVFSAGSGAVQFGACGLGSCTVLTDATGLAATTVIPLTAGSVSLLATGSAGSVTDVFTAIDAPNVMRLISGPTGLVYVGNVATAAFAVRVLKADGVTPVAGAAVVFSAGLSSVQFGACGLGSCTVLTDATGTASTTVTPLAVGAISLLASGATGSATTAFTAALGVRTVTAVQAVQYVAAGASVVWQPQVSLGDNSGTVAGVMVNWSGLGNTNTVTGTSAANAVGIASNQMSAGPLGTGQQATGSACAWGGTVCAWFAVQAVDPAALQVGTVSGSVQTVPVTGTLDPVVLQVTDGLGHPVAGAAVQVYQTVEAGVACPARGRCPAVAVAQQGQSVAVTDVNGLVSIAPLQESSVAEVTKLVVTSGTQGFVSLTLTKGW